MGDLNPGPPDPHAPGDPLTAQTDYSERNTHVRNAVLGLKRRASRTQWLLSTQGAAELARVTQTQYTADYEVRRNPPSPCRAGTARRA